MCFAFRLSCRRILFSLTGHFACHFRCYILYIFCTFLPRLDRFKYIANMISWEQTDAKRVYSLNAWKFHYIAKSSRSLKGEQKRKWKTLLCHYHWSVHIYFYRCKLNVPFVRTKYTYQNLFIARKRERAVKKAYILWNRRCCLCSRFWQFNTFHFNGFHIFQFLFGVDDCGNQTSNNFDDFAFRCLFFLCFSFFSFSLFFFGRNCSLATRLWWIRHFPFVCHFCVPFCLLCSAHRILLHVFISFYFVYFFWLLFVVFFVHFVCVFVFVDSFHSHLMSFRNVTNENYNLMTKKEKKNEIHVRLCEHPRRRRCSHHRCSQSLSPSVRRLCRFYLTAAGNKSWICDSNYALSDRSICTWIYIISILFLNAAHTKI